MATKTQSKKANSNRGEMRSFRVSPPDKPFFTFKITHQTFYWVAISLLVLALGVWVTFLSVRVQDIYDRIDHIVKQDPSPYKR
jgi:hypothetical protein